MKTIRANQSKGFILVSVLFLITVVAVMAVVMSSTSSVQSLTTAYSIQQSRAFFAAKSGLEYGIDQAVNAGACTNGGITLPGIDFNVTISCVSTPGINEGGNITTVYQLSATATSGSFGRAGYVTRTVRTMVN